MNFRQFYSRALLASLPIAADIILNHADALEEDDDLTGKPVDGAISEMAHRLAYETALHFGNQMDCWNESDAEPDRIIPKTTDDVTGPSGSESSLN